MYSEIKSQLLEQLKTLVSNEVFTSISTYQVANSGFDDILFSRIHFLTKDVLVTDSPTYKGLGGKRISEFFIEQQRILKQKMLLLCNSDDGLLVRAVTKVTIAELIASLCKLSGVEKEVVVITVLTAWEVAFDRHFDNLCDVLKS